MNGKSVLVTLFALCFFCAAARPQILHYKAPASFFEESLVIGNGKLGASIYSGVGCDSLSLNDITLWTGSPDTTLLPDGRANLALVRTLLSEGRYAEAEEANKSLQGHYSENYQPLGRVYIRRKCADDEATDYFRQLDIGDAVACAGFATEKGREQISYFASSPDSVIVVRIVNSKCLDFTIGYSLQLPGNISARVNSIIIDGYAAAHSLPVYLTDVPNKHFYDAAHGIRFRTIIKVIAPGSRVSANDSIISVEGGKEAIILISNETSFNGFDKDPATEGKDYKRIVARNIERASARSYKQLLTRHKADYKRFFDRVKIDLGTTPKCITALPTDVQLRNYTDSLQSNPELEALYFQFGRYLLISCSRTPGIPANLQGLWNERLLPPWSSNYTTNINLEENYWPAEVLNLGEMHLPLLQFTGNLAQNGKSTAKQLYGIERGWCLGHNSDLWAMTCPVGLQSGDPCWANWNMGGTWLATHIWEHYDFGRDKAFLKQYYPLLKGAAEFCLDWLVEKDGKLITSPGTSPENLFLLNDSTPIATSEGPTCDIAMIRECLTDAVKAAEELGTDLTFVSEGRSAMQRLQPYRIGSNGALQEWLVDRKEYEPHHRHQSHLFGLYPGHQISVNSTPELAKACHRTLELRGPESTGWSTGWRVNLYARLRDRDTAYATYRKLLRFVSPDRYKGADARRGGGTYPNLLDAHSPFQIDGNFGGAAGVAEMLIQSSAGDIFLLPACPVEWSEGSLSGVCARGGFCLSFRWEAGRVTDAEVTAVQDATTTLHCNGASYPVSLLAGQTKRLRF
ncbi:MAG: glycoside hydrolase family 95 protein [Prevotella sp.]|nr:glycoside hydrolase family 95 protein [Prevotella sp.]